MSTPPPAPARCCAAGGLLARDEINPVLNGTLPGDYGYDPLGLAKDAETLAKYRANELLHARWAMLAAAGAIIPEGLAANGADVKGATWFETGAAMLNGGTLNWFAVPFVNFNNPLPLFAVVAINVALMAAAENYRRTGEGGERGVHGGVAVLHSLAAARGVLWQAMQQALQPGLRCACSRLATSSPLRSVPSERASADLARSLGPPPLPAEDGPAGYAPGVGKFDESVYSNMDNLYPGEGIFPPRQPPLAWQLRR